MKFEAFTEPFRHWLIHKPVPDACAYNACRAARHIPADQWVQYDNDCERGKRTSTAVDEAPDMRFLFEELRSPAFCQRLSEETGVAPVLPDPELYGAGCHVTAPGGYLQPHLDFARHPTLPLERRLSLIHFLVPKWKEAWGGAFELWDDSARHLVKRIYPAYNTAVLFENSDISYHGTKQTAADAPPRITAASYYLSTPRPGCVRKRALYVPRRES